VVVLGAVATTSLVAASAQADNGLKPISAEQLLVDLQKSKVDGLSGTVIQQANLGLPAIPGAGRESSDMTSLVSGTHTLRVRYAAPDKSRLAVFGTLGETDVIANGHHRWTWSSKEKSATHTTSSEDVSAADRGTAPADAPKTPEEAAQQVLAALDPSTTVSTDASVKVAGRDAYELVLQPNDDASLIKQVRIAVDGANKQPLRVQVFAADKLLAFEVAYQQVSFTRPDDQEFEFKPPPGTTVTEKAAPTRPAPSAEEKAGAQDPADQAKSDTKVVGTGWTSVVITKLDQSDPTQAQGQLGDFLQQLPEVNVPGGKGRVLAGTAFSAILTDDGRLAVGAVHQDLLIKALGQ